MFKKLTFAVLAAAALAGCKLKIVVPEGGHVVSAGGTMVTHAQGSFEIEVNDFEFEDTFHAIADPADAYVIDDFNDGVLSPGLSDPAGAYLETGGVARNFSGTRKNVVTFDTDYDTVDFVFELDVIISDKDRAQRPLGEVSPADLPAYA